MWASEIEPYCQSVTAHHYPDMKQLGDITKINVDELEPVDIVCAGSPCQDLSVAGKREGLKGERSGLFKTAIDIFHRLREKSGGKTRFFVWENVPGAFSSNKGMDFRAVLEEVGQSEIPMPPNGKWANAGLVELPNCQITWRVIDAQYWGVPQRRRRIFLVADFAASGRCAREILFESEGLLGNTAESGGAGQSTPSDVERSTGEASGCDVYNGLITGDKGCSLTAGYGSNTTGPKVLEKTVVPSPEKNQGGIAIHEEKPICIEGNGARPSHKGDGYKESEVMYTLNCVDRHAVCPSKT